jgi:hypothetical protein
MRACEFTTGGPEDSVNTSAVVVFDTLSAAGRRLRETPSWN